MRITPYVHAATIALVLVTGVWAAEAPNYE